MNWLEYYGVYLGLKLHFEQKTYDYNKYGAKRVNESSVGRNYLLIKSIAGKRESKDAFEQRLTGIFRNKVVFLTELYTPESNKLVSDYVSETFNWSYNLETDISYLVETATDNGLTFKEMFKSDNEFRLPFVANELVKGKIKYHSFACLAEIIPFCDRITPMLLNVSSIEKYRRLHKFDKKKIATIVKPFLN